MNREEYLKKRNELMEKAKGLIETGEVANIEKSNQVMKEIEKLDSDFENAAKAAANLKALENGQVGSSALQNIVNTNIHEPIDQSKTSEKENMLYRDAFLNNLRGKELTDEQKDIFAKMNMTAGDNSIIVPEFTVSRIWRKVDELFPFYSETSKINVKGTYRLIQEDSSFDAEFYEESDETKSDGQETFKQYALSGCELSRAIDVSWKLKEMSMDDFEDYIVEKMAKKMGTALAHSSVTGKGRPGKDDTFKPEPYGVITVLENEEGTPQIIEVDANPTYEDLTALFALIKSTYKKTIYATNTYIWSVLAQITDKTGKPYFIPDTTAGGVGHIFGALVKEDDSIPQDAMLIGEAAQYLVNFNKTVTIDTEDAKKKRITSYIGYAIVDGAPITNKAFALLRKKKAAAKTANK